jgi:hypothetical protein
MIRGVLIVILAFGITSAAYGDVTLKQTMTSKGMGMSGTTPTTTYIKGNRMRSDVQVGDRVQTMIFDVDAQKMYLFDSKKKEADVFDMAAFGQEVTAKVDMANMKVSMKANGQTKEIAGKTATGYDVEISLPTSLGGSKEMAMVMTLSGPTWIVKGAPGTADYARFYKAAVDKGWIFSDPRVAKNQPGQAKAMAEMYKHLAEAGGVPYENDMQMKMGGGGGPMAGLFAKIGNVSFATKMDTVETGPLADDLFAPPTGYKLNVKK